MLVVDILNSLSTRHTVSLIVVNEEWDDHLISRLSPSVKVYLLKRKRSSRNPIPLLKLNWLLYRLKPDVVHCHEPKMVNMFVLKKFGKMLTIHDVKKQVPNFKKYDRLIAISDSVCEDFRKRYLCDVTIIPNGVDFNKFKKRREYKLGGGDGFKIIQVSRLMHEKKGQDILIEALAILKRKSHNTNLKLDFVGDGSSLRFLRELTAKCDLQDNVSFLGNKDKSWIENNLCKYDLLVQPSHYEGFGLTVVEAVAAGIPVVASNIEGPAEIFRRSPVKFLFRRSDSAECAELISQVLTHYQNGTVGDIVTLMHENIQQDFSIEQMVNRYENEYKKISQN